MNNTKVQNRSTKNDPVISALPAACHDEKAAVEFMEEQRWGAYPCCPHCGDMNVYQMMDSKEPTKRQANYRWRCRGCKVQYTVRTGTIYEDRRYFRKNASGSCKQRWPHHKRAVDFIFQIV